eukprot:PRCOL_00006806-RA
MTPAPIWSRLLVTFAACATLSLGLRDVLAPGLVLNFVPGDVHVQAVWASVGEGWAALHAQQMAGVFWVFTSIMKLVEIGRDEHNMTIMRVLLGLMDAGLLYFVIDLFFQELQTGRGDCLRPIMALQAISASTMLMTTGADEPKTITEKKEE